MKPFSRLSMCSYVDATSTQNLQNRQESTVCDVDNTGVSSRNCGDELLEDWPVNRLKPNNRESKKQVRFSESSSMRLYKEDFSYSKSYTKADRKMFGKRLIMEAYIIKKAVADIPDCTIETCGIEKERIIGLENLAFSKSPSDVSKLRKFHVQAVLLEQEKQNILEFSDDDRIAGLSQVISRKAGQAARMRAAIAA